MTSPGFEEERTFDELYVTARHLMVLLQRSSEQSIAGSAQLSAQVGVRNGKLDQTRTSKPQTASRYRDCGSCTRLSEIVASLTMSNP